MDEAVIYGLDFQTRTLAARTAESEYVHFFVGTQSLKCDNQIHLIVYDDDSNSVSKAIFLHKEGEIWDIACSPSDKNLLATCYNKVLNPNVCHMNAALWRIPDEVEFSSGGSEDSAVSQSMDFLCNVAEQSEQSQDIRCVKWQPGEEGRLASVVDNQVLLWDVSVTSEDTAKISGKIVFEAKNNPRFTTGQWNPHHGNYLFATATDNNVRAWDIRSLSAAWSIESAHSQIIRDMDFNPNKQYYLATCGDDCSNKFWDVRNVKQPVETRCHHSHWVWNVRYNHFHDQLVLTSSSDSKVVLSCEVSISSEPYGKLIEEYDEIKPSSKDKQELKDGVILVYSEHEDSVYCAQWSTSDPWTFAALSYDGRLVINKVPRNVKYKILL